MNELAYYIERYFVERGHNKRHAEDEYVQQRLPAEQPVEGEHKHYTCLLSGNKRR